MRPNPGRFRDQGAIFFFCIFLRALWARANHAPNVRSGRDIRSFRIIVYRKSFIMRRDIPQFQAGDVVELSMQNISFKNNAEELARENGRPFQQVAAPHA